MWLQCLKLCETTRRFASIKRGPFFKYGFVWDGLVNMMSAHLGATLLFRNSEFGAVGRTDIVACIASCVYSHWTVQIIRVLFCECRITSARIIVGSSFLRTHDILLEQVRNSELRNWVAIGNPNLFWWRRWSSNTLIMGDQDYVLWFWRYLLIKSTIIEEHFYGCSSNKCVNTLVTIKYTTIQQCPERFSIVL